MSHCPNCKSDDIRRSRTQTRWERWRKEITGKRPYRCRGCNWRWWLPIEVGDALDQDTRARRHVADPPNLSGTIFARPDPHRQFDITTLDAFDHRRDA